MAERGAVGWLDAPDGHDHPADRTVPRTPRTSSDAAGQTGLPAATC